MPYSEAAHAALFGKVPYSPALASRVELLQAKTRACSAAVYGAFLQGLGAKAIKEASLSLRAQGWGALTFFSAAQHLTGLRALELVDELHEVGGQQAAIDELVQAIAVAGTLLREAPAGPSAAAAVAKALRIATAAAHDDAEQAAA